jgi:hypothetical protein
MTQNPTPDAPLAHALALVAGRAGIRPWLDALDLAIGELRIRQERLKLSARAAGFIEPDLLPPEVDRDVRRLQETVTAIDGLGALKRALIQANEKGDDEDDAQTTGQ